MEKKRKSDPVLGLFIYNLVNSSNKSIDDIAEAIGVEPRTISYYCSGERKPSATKMIKLLKVTNHLSMDIPF